ncbi:hypothetical protein [Bacillus cereus]|uniref:hypothetical protein n=1 Tax=Bacillus cereus TaxID=1396 RepID=UPI003012A71C
MIYQYEIDFSIVYSHKITASHVATFSASSLTAAIEKLEKEVQRRLGHCKVIIHETRLYVSKEESYTMPYQKEKTSFMC